MLGAVCLCVLALALPCWTFPSAQVTTCKEFGRGVSFDPVNAVGEWYEVHNVKDVPGNDTEKTTIKELTSSQLEQYDHILTRYSKDKLKLELKSRVTHPVVNEADVVLVPQDNEGNVDAYVTRIQRGSTNVPALSVGPFQLKWKIVDGFLVTMRCSDNDLNVMSKTTTVEKDKLQRALDSLGVVRFTPQSLF